MIKDSNDNRVYKLEKQQVCSINGHFFGIERVIGLTAECDRIHGTHSYIFKCIYCGIRYERYQADLTDGEKKIVPLKPKRDLELRGN